MIHRNTYCILLCFVIVSGLLKQASAELLTITSLPLEIKDPLPHTNFHSADLGDGTGGVILGWAILSPDTVSTYDPVTGALNLHLKIYTSSGFNSFLGNAHGVSSNLVGSDFNQFDGNVIGTINWTFDSNVAGSFFSGDQSKTSHTMTFVDFNYVTTADNFTANSWDGTNLTLWGADGIYLGANFEGGGRFDTKTTTIGFDFVGVTGNPVVPEPSSIMLLLMGTTCFGGVGFWKRRRRGAQLSEQN